MEMDIRVLCILVVVVHNHYSYTRTQYVLVPFIYQPAPKMRNTRFSRFSYFSFASPPPLRRVVAAAVVFAILFSHVAVAVASFVYLVAVALRYTPAQPSPSAALFSLFFLPGVSGKVALFDRC